MFYIFFIYGFKFAKLYLRAMNNPLPPKFAAWNPPSLKQPPQGMLKLYLICIDLVPRKLVSTNPAVKRCTVLIKNSFKVTPICILAGVKLIVAGCS